MQNIKIVTHKNPSKMKARKIEITYEINGRTAVARHSNQTVFYAVRIMAGSLRRINRNGERVPHAKIVRVKVEY